MILPNKLTFLMDTGAAISVLPPSSANTHTISSTSKLLMALVLPLMERSLSPSTGLRRSLPWIFMVADVSKPLLGAGFLHHFHLSVDLNSKKLVDNTTQLSISGVCKWTLDGLREEEGITT